MGLLRVIEALESNKENEQIGTFAHEYPLELTGKHMTGSLEFRAECHWLIKDLVLIGEYPLSEKYIDHLVQEKNINTFICMVDLKHEVMIYDDLTNYWNEWIVKNEKYKDHKIDILQSPIRDFSVSDDQTMINFLIQIVKHVINGWTNNENKKYYMHCMTGHGRTGLISVLLLMCLYRIECQKALDLLKKYHVNRDCQNGKYFYNSCDSAMRIRAKQYDPKKYSLQAYYPMPQESSQFKQIQKLQNTMHQIHDKYVANSKIIENKE